MEEKRTSSFRRNLWAWFCLVQLALTWQAQASWAESEPSLTERIGQGWSYQLRLVGFGMATEAAQTPRNPENRIMALPQHTVGTQVRPDFRLDLDRLSLALQPRAEWYWESWDQGPEAYQAQRSDAFIHQWLVRLRCTEALYASYGRENLQWGPAYLTSLSNPFFEDNGKSNPKLELPAMDFARLVWVPSLTWGVSLIANTDQGRQDISNAAFEERYALKIDYTGSADYGSLIFTYREAALDQVSGFYGRTLSDAVLVYAEGVVQRDPAGLYPQGTSNPLGYVMSTNDGSDDTWIGSMLGGLAYTLESGPTLSLEYLYYGPGYDDDEAQAFFDLLARAAGELQAGTVLTPLAYQALGATADPGLRFLRRNYLMLQATQNDIVDVIDLTVRWTRNLDDGSQRATLIAEWSLGDHLELFGIGNWDHGNERSEFGSIIDRQIMLGLTVIF
ncbi:MAG: hypothetical protein HY911_05910 [Desulfobacterales bacterium]|nr:hypothetical protein [Desulfobacterales bacterium]